MNAANPKMDIPRERMYILTVKHIEAHMNILFGITKPNQNL